MFMQNTSRLLAKTAPPNAARVTGHEAKQRPGVAKAAFPGGFLHPLLPVDHNPSSLRFLAVTLTACVCGHLEKDIYSL